MPLFRAKRYLIALLLLCFTLCFVIFTGTSIAAPILISKDHNVDSHGGVDTVNLITRSGSFSINIISSSGTNQSYTFNGSTSSNDIYLESLDNTGGKEIIVLYTESGASNLRKLSIT